MIGGILFRPTFDVFQGHNHVGLTAAAFVLIGGLLGWVGAKIGSNCATQASPLALAWPRARGKSGDVLAGATCAKTKGISLSALTRQQQPGLNGCRNRVHLIVTRSTSATG